MRLANLRGLLKPDYPHGVRSQVRELLILRDLEREVESKILPFAALLDAATLTVVDGNSRKKVVENAGNLLENAVLLGKLCSADSKELRKLHTLKAEDTKDMMKAFYLLKEGGLGDILHQALKKG